MFHGVYQVIPGEASAEKILPYHVQTKLISDKARERWSPSEREHRENKVRSLQPEVAIGRKTMENSRGAEK